MQRRKQDIRPAVHAERISALRRPVAKVKSEAAVKVRWGGYFLRAVRRNFWNRENGPFNVNLNDDLRNRKLSGTTGNLNPNLGARLRAVQAGQDLMF
jgi:hypothetical protein